MTLDELDRLAAEKVMGMQELSAKDFIPVPNDGKLYFTKLHAPECCPEPWQPTRNIAQAWECLEKFDKIGHSISMCNLRKGDWNCEIIDRDDGCFSSKAETAPLAIVRACLKAKGVEV